MTIYEAVGKFILGLLAYIGLTAGMGFVIMIIASAFVDNIMDYIYMVLWAAGGISFAFGWILFAD